MITTKIFSLIKEIIDVQDDVYLELLYNNESIIKEDFQQNLNRVNFGKTSDTSSIELKIYFDDPSLIDKISEKKSIILSLLERLLRINERILFHEQLKKMNENLENMVKDRTKKLEETIMELDSFAGAVSHDLQKPITIIQGYTDLFSLEDDDDKKRKYIEKILFGCNKMKVLIRELLQLSKISKVSLKKTKIDLSILIRKIIDESFPNTIDKVDFKIQNNVFAYVDKEMFKIALENLLSNAIKYSSKRDDPMIEFGLTENTYYIRDNGAGFSMKEYNKLFKSFSRIHHNSEFEGSGLGLHTVNRIISRHDGKIWAQSEPGKGTTFFFNLG